MAKHPNYELFEELGRGENSVVFRAYDLVLGRDVAIKELSSEPGSDGGQADARRIDQFLKEASFLAQFEHENVLRIHTVDKDRGWIVMELMKGTLSSQIDSQPMEPDTVRSVLRQMLTALDFLHQKDKVHGAVRPSNILINEYGTVKLSDFEASSRDGELRAPTGSKKYLAPELIRSDFGEFGPAVDLYCLGFTALELLTGKKFDSLFPGTGAGAIDADVAWLRWHSSDEALRPVSEIAKSVPADLARVIDALVQKSVSDRPQTAAEVLKLLDDGPIVPVPVPESKSKDAKSSVDAILPTKAVKLRDPATVRTTRKSDKTKSTKPAKPAKTKDGLNEFLGRPYILWPICVGILSAAVFVGLKLRTPKPEFVSGPPPKVPPLTEPIAGPEPVAVTIRVLPDPTGARLFVEGEPKEIAGLKLQSGSYEFTIEKDGYQRHQSVFVVGREGSEFEVTLIETPTPEPIAGVGEPEPKKPDIVDIRIAVTPRDASVRLDGNAIELEDGLLRVNRDEIGELKLSADAEGFEALSKTWSWEELAAVDYGVELSLEKMAPAVIKRSIPLPDSLIAKADSPLDPSTGLPQRVFVRRFYHSTPLELALVTPGTYKFGIQEGEPRTWEIAGDTVRIENPFYIGIDEVSGAQFEQFASAVGEDHNTNTHELNLPVANVSVRQAARFCDWVGGRLPTEIEWEAAVRGQDDAGFPLPWGPGGLDPNKCKLFRGEKDEHCSPAEVGELTAGANKLGLLNTIGNLSEWCATQYSADAFVIKGCSYRIPPGNHVRVTWRNYAKWDGANDIGLRLVVPVVAEEAESIALSFVAPTNLNEVLQSDNDEPTERPAKYLFTKSVKEIAEEFTGPAELVIDSGGFMDEINDVKFSPDGKHIAVSGGKVARIWNVESGELVQTLRGDRSRTSYGNANAVAYSPDGRFLLVGVSDYRDHGNIRVYETANYDEIKELLVGHAAPCRKLCFSRDGKYLTSVDANGMVLVWDWESRTILQRIPARDREQPIYDLMSFPTDEPYLLGVDFEGPQVYSALSGKRLGGQDSMPIRVRGWLVDIYNQLVRYPYDTKKEPRVMDFRMEENRWAGAGSAVVDGASRFWIRVWESRDPVSAATPVRELAAYDKHRWNVTALALQPKGSLVASGDKFGEVHVWDSQTGQRLFKFAGQGKPIYKVAFDKDSTRLAFGTKPYAPGVWKRNNHGDATQVLDLHERTIASTNSREALNLLTEQPTIGDASVSVRKKDAYYYVQRMLNSQLQSQYRISAGRNPTVYTLLDDPKLGVEQPVVFGDNEGLLALWDSATDELKRAFIGHDNLVSAVSASSNGKLIASSSTDRTIRLWSLENHVSTGIFDFKFENTAVREVIPGTSSAEAGVRVGDKIASIDGKSLQEMFELMLAGKFEYQPEQVVPVKMSRDGETYEYNMKLAQGYDFVEPILNFYVGDDGQWIIWHPQGYYDASPGADRLIGWHLNRGPDKSARFFEVQQFRKKLYRPDVIDGILEHGSLKEALAQLEDSSYEKDPVDFRDPETIAENHPPGVQITYPTNGWSTGESKVTVKGEAYSVNGLPLTALTLLHNGAVAKVFRPTKVDQLAMLIEHEIQLEPGNNDLVLIAANAKSSSQGKHIVVDLTGQTQPRRPNAVVLAIGVSDFSDSLSSLPKAATDAEAFVSAMNSHDSGRLYSNVQTKLLAGNVEDSDILDGFQWLADNTKDGDVAMIYIASHGLIDRRDNFYIGSSNTVESKARSTAVSWRDLMDTLQLDLPDCKRMVFLDLEPTKAAIKPGLRSPLLDLAAPEMGTVFLSSNTLQQKPVQLASSNNGAFLRAVLETVGDRKFDNIPKAGDSLFNPVELAAGVTTRVKALTRDKQQPVFFTPEYTKFVNVLELQN